MVVQDLFDQSVEEVAVSSCLDLNWHSKASPERLPKASLDSFNPAVAASAALPALTMLAEDAEAKYGDNRKWSAVLVPLTTLASRWFWRRQKCRAERL